MALADGTGLYRIRGEAGLLLYIGISKHFGRRWEQHAKKQPWWEEMRSLSVDEWFPGRDDARKAEVAAILAEQPKYNKQHVKPPRARPVPGARPVRTARRRALPALSKVDRLALNRIASLRDGSPKLYEEAQARACPSCHAKPGDLCRTKHGNVAYFHLDRWGSDGRRPTSSHQPPADLSAWSSVVR